MITCNLGDCHQVAKFELRLGNHWLPICNYHKVMLDTRPLEIKVKLKDF